jgi:hypothetical protein
MDGEYSLGVIENSLSQSGLARINVSANANVSQFLNVVHDENTSKKTTWSIGVMAFWSAG